MIALTAFVTRQNDACHNVKDGLYLDRADASKTRSATVVTSAARVLVHVSASQLAGWTYDGGGNDVYVTGGCCAC